MGVLAKANVCILEGKRRFIVVILDKNIQRFRITERNVDRLDVFCRILDGLNQAAPVRGNVGNVHNGTGFLDDEEVGIRFLDLGFFFRWRRFFVGRDNNGLLV